MTDNSSALQPSASAIIIAAACVLTALLQVVAGVKILDTPEGEALLSTADSVVYMQIFLPLGAAVLLNLAAGIAVFRMRVEALACLGYLMAKPLSQTVSGPFQLLTVLNVGFALVLLYFTMRLFRPLSAHRFTMLLAGLAVGQLTMLLANVPAYFMLASNGSKQPLVVLTSLLGCVTFYAGMVAMRSRPRSAKRLFLFAALAMGLTLPAWSAGYGFSAPFWLGVVLALFGFAQVSAHCRSRL